jgi:two-component system chemotaxis response regulator CheY|tara:strand:- start:435 stop:818 length:384 start_codon:yes stop_codon:yes gene_type:complete
MYILLIDDKQAILDIVTPLLINSGHTVETASNGLDAYEKAQQKTFDLYIIDHLMPVMNGLQLSKNLLNNPFTANTPAIFMTTQNLTEVTALTRSLSFQTIITKPIDAKSLLNAVNQTNEQNTTRYSL